MEATDETEEELVTSTLWDLGTTGIFQGGDGSMVAGFETEAAAERAWERLSTDDELGVLVESGSVEPAPPVDHWVEDDGPSQVRIATAGGPVELQVRAGGAFGHGGHETTALALDLLLEHVRPGDRVLDVGTGTGVLGMAAAAAGAGRVVCTDNDPVALDVARRNVAANEPADGWSISCGLWTVDKGLDVLGGRPDVVVINVLLAVHRELAETVRAGLGDRGRLITTGFLRDQEDELAALYHPPLVDLDRHHRGDWSAIVFGRQPPDSEDT